MLGQSLMKVRSLLSWFPAASVLFAMRSKGDPVAPPAVTEAGFSIAVQCWSFKEFTLFEAIEFAAMAGAHVELFPGQKIGGPLGDLPFGPELTDENLQVVIGHLDRHRIRAVNFGVTPVSTIESEARPVFELARKLKLHGITTESLEAIDVLEKLAIEYDIRVCLHNHPKPTSLWNPEETLKAIESRHPNIGFCADVGHWASSGLDPRDTLRKIAPRVHSFHMKDRESLAEWSHDRPFGTGAMDISGMLDDARRHGFSGNVTIEYEHNWACNVVEIAQCAGYLRAYSAMTAKRSRKA